MSGNSIVGDITSAERTKLAGISTGADVTISLLADTAPATASAVGVKGQVRSDTAYIYICVATNTWERAAIATW